MQTPSFVIRNLLYIIKCCKVFVNSMFVFRQRQRAENPPRRLRIFVKDAHLQIFLSFLKKTLDFPGGGRYNKTRSPARTPREYAPVAQLDRVSDYESEGRGFESLRARHFYKLNKPMWRNWQTHRTQNATEFLRAGSSPATGTITVKVIDTIVSVTLTFFYAPKRLLYRTFHQVDAPAVLFNPQYMVFYSEKIVV